VKVLHLRAQGGLCNRLRTIASGMKWKAMTEAERLVVHWNLNREMNARYTSFFEVPGGVTVLEQDEEPTLERIAFSPRMKRWLPTWHSDYENWLSATDFSWVRLRPEMQARVDAVRCRLPVKCVGVHVRRTDNTESIRCSPMSAFYREMDKALEEGANGFFLASDSEPVKDDLTSRYGKGRIVTCERVAARDSPDGVRDAVVDLTLLASTKRIIGSYYSSFSETAAAIGGIGFVCATQ